ncbi:MAG TPA: deoxynucleoside kinase [Spirochaetia bacterium]|nr:deoxynucleoside kinase [Spirochaetia bacterium]
MKRFVVLAGNIGAGKSTLVRLLCAMLGWKPYYEPVAENPFLEDFYRDMSRWAFHSQVFFLSHRVRSHAVLLGDPYPVVQDRSLYEDAEVFARNLFLHGRLTEREWTTYQELYRTVSALLPAPDLVVYLRASVPTLRRRIDQRGRGLEAGITDGYLSELNELYESWIGHFTLCPILTVPGDTMDFVAQSRDLESIAAAVVEHLRGSQGILFPEADAGASRGGEGPAG